MDMELLKKQIDILSETQEKCVLIMDKLIISTLELYFSCEDAEMQKDLFAQLKNLIEAKLKIELEKK